PVAEVLPEPVEIEAEITDEFPEWLDELSEEEPFAAEAIEALVVEEAASPIDLDDADAALAWLESLAAKQGVAEEELITRPEDRIDTPPDWVQKAATADRLEWRQDIAEEAPAAETLPEPEAEVTVAIPDWLRDIAVEAPAAEALPEPEAEVTDDIPDWLRDMGEEVPVTEVIPKPVEIEAEITDELPEWLAELSEEEPVAAEVEKLPAWVQETLVTEAQPIEAPEEETKPEVAEEFVTDEIPDWLRESTIAESYQEETSALTAEIDSTIGPEAKEIPAELPEPITAETEAKLISLPLDEEEPTEILPEEETSEPTFKAEAKIEPPAWVLEGEAPKDEVYEWIPHYAKREVTAKADELLDINAASMIQLERLPSLGFRRAQSIVAYRDEHGEFGKIEDLLDVPGMDAETLATIKSQTTVKAPEKTAPPTPVIPEIVPEDEHHIKQLEAQNLLAHGDIDSAIKKYGQLIKKGKRLDDIITDLDQAIYRHPMDISILQALGDAYMRAGQLQDALDVYSKAEELLR
ncbi:MAG: helix-hairpin-helix domain-containing protein, partial [Chloroflexota bacterium]